MLIDKECELWLPVIGYEDLYYVSNCGRVKRLKGTPYNPKADRILKPKPYGDGYKGVVLYCGIHKAEKVFYIHSLVMLAFVGPVPIGKEVNHKNGCKDNNCLDNLEYVTHSENAKHAFRTGLNKAPCGEVHRSAKFTEDEVRKIRTEHENNPERTHQSFADQYGVNKSVITRIFSREIWKHI